MSNKEEPVLVYKLPNLINTFEFKENIPKERGILTYDKKTQKITHTEKELQVPGSLSRYMHPKYKDIFFGIKNIIENLIEEKLYPTYYFDRFYFANQKLDKHIDRPSCEISVTITLDHNVNYDWPIWFELPNKTILNYATNPGDGILYLGTGVPHWREPLIGDNNSYWHQIFFHYVRADGPFVQHAFDVGIVN